MKVETIENLVSGVGVKYDARGRNLLPVYDMQKKGYRMINAETITSVRCQGVELKVTQDESI